MEKVELAKEIADVKFAMNRKQVVVALAGGEPVYFELDSTGQLNEFTERTSWPHEVLCMSLSEPRNCLSTLVAMAEDENVPVVSVDDEKWSSSKSSVKI
ncbi:unnamed protein product [Cylicocyclus nassatus]|uniref:RSE1/DDB1/CPSF1 second beta-propeller domain-containing protein n=1 Tax=Cylicocyclus nassatus TaxID=53992 RepID=A0AA36DP75_CYLNA|nr:unnamed protein product [Cylicocyclus nassatus]